MSAKKRALGRGLDSLLGVPASDTKSDESPAGREILELRIEQIRPNPHQPRSEFNEETISELAESIRQKGILQPLLVRRKHGVFELIAGERRFRAAQRVGLETIPCIPVEVSDAESCEIALIENLQREDLNPVEEARAYRALIDQFDLNQDEVALRVGKSRPAVANSLRLLNLPLDIQEDLLEGRLSPGHARAILSVSNDPKRRRLRNLIISKGLSVREAEREAKHLETGENAPADTPKNASSETNAQLQALQDAFSTRLGLNVTIQPSSGKAGRIVIHYKSLDDFENITSFFGIET